MSLARRSPQLEEEKGCGEGVGEEEGEDEWGEEDGAEGKAKDGLAGGFGGVEGLGGEKRRGGACAEDEKDK